MLANRRFQTRQLFGVHTLAWLKRVPVNQTHRHGRGRASAKNLVGRFGSTPARKPLKQPIEAASQAFRCHRLHPYPIRPRVVISATSAI